MLVWVFTRHTIDLKEKTWLAWRLNCPLTGRKAYLSYWSAIAQINDFSAAYSWRPSKTNTATEQCKECKYFSDWDLSQLTDVRKERKCVTFNLPVLHLPSMNSSVNWKSLHIRLEAASQQDEESATKNTASNQNQTLYEFVQKKNGGGKFNLNVIICIWTPLFTPILLQKGFPCDSSRSFSPQTCSFFSFLFFLFLGDFLKKLWKLFKGKRLLVKTWWQSTGQN